jgi:hypothetical protein
MQHKAMITNLTPPLPDAYNLDFPTFGSAGIEKFKKFIQALDKRATWARSAEDRADSVIVNTFQRSPIVALGSRGCRSRIVRNFASLIPEIIDTTPDLIRSSSPQALKGTLSTNFARPILYRAARPDSSVPEETLSSDWEKLYKTVPGEILALDTFWDYLRERTNTTRGVYDYSVDETADG